jgi:hypothetical protein
MGEIVIPRTARNDKITDVSQRHADVANQIRTIGVIRGKKIISLL